MWAIQICIASNGTVAFLRLVSHMTVLNLQSDWRMEIPQRRPKDLAQVHQTLFPLEGGVWARDYVYTGLEHSRTVRTFNRLRTFEDCLNKVYIM